MAAHMGITGTPSLYLAVKRVKHRHSRKTHVHHLAILCQNPRGRSVEWTAFFMLWVRHMLAGVTEKAALTPLSAATLTGLGAAHPHSSAAPVQDSTAAAAPLGPARDVLMVIASAPSSSALMLYYTHSAGSAPTRPPVSCPPPSPPAAASLSWPHCMPPMRRAWTRCMWPPCWPACPSPRRFTTRPGTSCLTAPCL